MSSTTHTKVFNKGKRTISGSYPNPNANAEEKFIEYALAPESHAAFPTEEANKLRRLFPKEILSLDDVKATFEDKPEPAKEAETKNSFISISEAKAQQEAAINAAVAQALAAQEKQHAEEIKEVIKAAAGDKVAEPSDAPQLPSDAPAADDADFAAMNTIAKAASPAKATGKKAS